MRSGQNLQTSYYFTGCDLVNAFLVWHCQAGLQDFFDQPGSDWGRTFQGVAAFVLRVPGMYAVFMRELYNDSYTPVTLYRIL